MSEVLTTEDAIAALGGPLTQPEEDAPPADNPPAEDPPADNNPPAETPSADNPTAENPPADNPPADNVDRSAQAFIHMRQQNANLNKLLKGVGAVLGLAETDISDEAKLTQALQARVLANQAENQKVPVEILTRLQQLEERDQQFTALQRQQNAAVGFQNVKDTFGLDQTQLNKFASELVQRGLNPLLMDNIDMVGQYKMIHHDDIVKAEVAKAIAEEQARAAKANNSAPTPNRTAGTGGGGKDLGKVESVQDLEKFLADNVR